MPDEFVSRDVPEAAKRADVWMYLAWAFGLTWVGWAVVLRLHAPEMLLSIGSAGPAVAALIASRCRPALPLRLNAGRLALAGALTALGSAVLSLYYGWRTVAPLPTHIHWDPWTLVPAALPAWILSARLSGDPGTREIGCSLFRFTRWSLVALTIFPAILITGEVIGRWRHLALVMPASHGSVGDDVAFAVVLFMYNALFAGVLEEPGWRGCLLVRLQRTGSPLTATLLVWLPWALWHAPLDFTRPGGFSLPLYLESRVVFLLPIALLLTWLYNKSRSLQACVLFHASMNTFPFVLPYWMPAFILLFVLAGYAATIAGMWKKNKTLNQS